MHVSPPPCEPAPQRYRPSTVSVFAAAFVAGAVVAFGLNRMLDAHHVQSRPQVESVPIFVALRSLPQGAPVTVWDVALRDWPKAMLPTTALAAKDSFEGMILKHPLREGQPLLSVHLVQPQPVDSAAPPQDEVFAAPIPATPQARAVEADLWAPVSAAAVPPPETLPATAEPTLTTQAEATVPPSAALPTEQLPTKQLPTVAISSSPIAEGTQPEATQPDVIQPEPAQPELAQPNPDAAQPSVARTGVIGTTPPDAVDPPDDPEATAVASDEVSEAFIQDAASGPTLAETVPPVPASPLTDIEQPLKAVSSQRLASRGPAFTDTPYSGPAVAESVLTDAVAANATSSATSSASMDANQQPLRYLVVPERIAVEADVSFVNQRPVAEQPQAPPSRASGRPQPTAAVAPPTQVPPRKQAAASAPPQAPSQRPIGTFFPNVAAGLDALGTFRGSQAPQPTRSR